MTVNNYHTIHGLKLKDYLSFVEAIEEGFGWIDINDIQRQWEGFFSTQITNSQVDFLSQALQENNLTRNEIFEDDYNYDYEEDEPYDDTEDL